MSYRKSLPIILGLAAIAIILSYVAISCTPLQLSNADRAVGGMPLVATTQPGPTTNSVVTLSPTNAQLTIHVIQDALASPAGQAATTAVAASSPIGAIAVTALTLITAVLGVFGAKQTSSLNTANNVIAAAAGPAAKLIQQVTDNQHLATDVTEISQIAPGLMDLISHPAAPASAIVTATTPAPLPPPPSAFVSSGPLGSVPVLPVVPKV